MKPVARAVVTNAQIAWSAFYPTELAVGEHELYTADQLREARVKVLREAAAKLEAMETYHM